MPTMQELQPTMVDQLQHVQDSMVKHRKKMKLRGNLNSMHNSVASLLKRAAVIGTAFAKSANEVAPLQENDEQERAQKLINTIRRGWKVQDEHHGEGGNFSGNTSSHDGGISQINNNSPSVNAL